MSLPELTPAAGVGIVAPPSFGALPLPARKERARAFRPDIDGLRAIAIVLVVLSHMGIAKVSGGFVGVDIFFVISGYLLTGNIAQNITAGTFSIAGFYERRIRRIVPALVAMLLATSVLACAVFPPNAVVLYGESLLSALFSYSNFYFFTQSGYFSLTFTKLLLHTWSLGVEEQFYLVLPICMLLAARTGARGTRRVVGYLGLCSLSLAIYLTYANRTLAFFMPYTRAWELLLGSALALGMLPTPASRRLRETLAAVSMLLILGCLFSYSESTPFPGLGALAPCVAATMLIAVGERGRTTVTSFLFWRPVVFVGAISYSLYLWHWPVMLFLRLGIVPKLDYHGIPGLAVLKIVLSFALAALSWRFVEQPFRTGRWKTLSRGNVFAGAVMCAVAVSAIAVMFIGDRGLPQRFPAVADRVGDYLALPSTRKAPGCFVETSITDFNWRFCLAPVPGKANVLLLGDSHANALWLGLSRALPEANVLQATGSTCHPIEGNYDRSTCGSLRRFMYVDYLPTHRLDAVVLTEAWDSLRDVDALEPALRSFRERRTPVYIIGPAPKYSAPLPLLLMLSQAWHRPGLALRRQLPGMGELDRALGAKLARRPGVRYVSLWRAICPDDRCQEYVDPVRGIPMFSDDNHVTDEGATLAFERLQAAGLFPR